MPNKHGAHKYPPHDPAQGQLCGCRSVAVNAPTNDPSAGSENRDLGSVDIENRTRSFFQPAVVGIGDDVTGVAVVERQRATAWSSPQQPASVRPTKAIIRRMWIGGFVGVDMVEAVGRHPSHGRVFEGA